MQNDPFLMDFLSDFANECMLQLLGARYTVSPSSDSESLIRAYLNVRRRRVPIQPRKVEKADYAVPSFLVDGDREFLEKVVAGDDLRPHQSMSIDKPDYNDGMFDDFGIHHFHLGANPHPKNPHFVTRTGPLLFALVTDDVFYCIGYYSHGEWSRSELLDKVHANWPDTISTYSMRGVESIHTYTDGEHQKLRNAQINTPTQRPDGTVHTSPGGGITLAGTSIKDEMHLNGAKTLCSNLENQIKTQAAKILATINVEPPVQVRLLFDDGAAYADIDGGRAVIDLSECLALPPL